MEYLTRVSSPHPAVRGRHVRCGARQSIPSSSMESCAGVTLIFPSAGEGQTKRPRSSRFENRHPPWPSHQTIFRRSPRRPRKTNRWPENGSSFSTFSAAMDRPLKPLRMSVTPDASQTFVCAGTGITLHRAPVPARRSRRGGTILLAIIAARCARSAPTWSRRLMAHLKSGLAVLLVQADGRRMTASI